MKSCEQVPAPVIQQPFVGQDTVTVTDAIPGARILVYDQALDEIGDGAGELVPLDQALVANDILACCSRSASAPALLATRSPRSAPTDQGCSA